MQKTNLLTTQEVAEKLGVSTARVRQLLAQGSLKAVKEGGKYRGQWKIHTHDVEIYLQKKGESGKMRVKYRMTPNPITATPDTSYNQALRIMKQNNIKHLPILDEHGKLIGIVTHSDLLLAQPSPVTTLSVFEIASLLEKVTMDKIMSKPVLAVEESCSITNAAHFMLTNDIGCLPVMRGEELVGIITDTDIFRTFIEITGGGQAGSHIEARLPNEKGRLAPLIKALTDSNSDIISVTITYEETGEHAYVDIKERGGDESKLRAALENLPQVKILEFRPGEEDKLLRFS